MTRFEQRNIEAWIEDAHALGVEHAVNAASWVVDGNSSVEERARVLAMLRAGDPAADNYLPRRPNLSGEFADDLHPQRLAADIAGEPTGIVEESDLEEGDLIDALADAYEQGVDETFFLECERLLILFCEEDS